LSIRAQLSLARHFHGFSKQTKSREQNEIK